MATRHAPGRLPAAEPASRSFRRSTVLATALAAACACSTTPARLAPVPLADLTVEAGSVEQLAGGRLGLRRPCIRAVAAAAARAEVELEFVYLGPGNETAPLASGELRRQIGLKLRAQDPCNVVYVMWHLAPTTGVHVSVKSNPGLRTHAECRDRGYRNLRPLERRAAPVIRPGQTHLLRARLEGDFLRVTTDGVVAWEGPLPPEALAFDGPVGLRSDNGQFDVWLLIGAR